MPTVKELKSELTDLGLPTDGLKADLIARLEEHKKSGATAAQPADGPAPDAAEPEPAADEAEGAAAAVDPAPVDPAPPADADTGGAGCRGRS